MFSLFIAIPPSLLGTGSVVSGQEMMLRPDELNYVWEILLLLPASWLCAKTFIVGSERVKSYFNKFANGDLK